MTIMIIFYDMILIPAICAWPSVLSGPVPTGFFDLLYLWPVYTNLPKRIRRAAKGETAMTLERR